MCGRGRRNIEKQQRSFSDSEDIHVLVACNNETCLESEHRLAFAKRNNPIIKIMYTIPAL
jgi:hypothetical protein